MFQFYHKLTQAYTKSLHDMTIFLALSKLRKFADDKLICPTDTQIDGRTSLFCRVITTALALFILMTILDLMKMAESCSEG